MVKSMSSRLKGVTNNGGSRGDEGRELRRLYNQHGITPPADLGTHKKQSTQEGGKGRRSRYSLGKRTQIYPGVERWDFE